MDTIGKRLRALRKHSGKTQQVVADFCCISQIALSRYECGIRVPSGRACLALAVFYNVSTDYILRGEDDEDNSVTLIRTG